MLVIGLASTALRSSVALGAISIAPEKFVGPEVILPWYFGGVPWGDGVRPPKMAIFNPDSGPGVAVDDSVRTSAAAAAEAGVKLVGYIDTAYAKRDLQLVLAEVAKYRAWYGVQSVFLDQMKDSCSSASYYRSIFRAVHDASGAGDGATVIVNPGKNVGSCLNDVADIQVIFEGSADEFDSWSPTRWTHVLPANKFCVIVYGVDPSEADVVLRRMSRNRVGYGYITDRRAPNPYDRAPAYSVWARQRELAGKAIPSGSASRRK